MAILIITIVFCVFIQCIYSQSMFFVCILFSLYQLVAACGSFCCAKDMLQCDKQMDRQTGGQTTLQHLFLCCFVYERATKTEFVCLYDDKYHSDLAISVMYVIVMRPSLVSSIMCCAPSVRPSRASDFLEIGNP